MGKSIIMGPLWLSQYSDVTLDQHLESSRRVPAKPSQMNGAGDVDCSAWILFYSDIVATIKTISLLLFQISAQMMDLF